MSEFVFVSAVIGILLAFLACRLTEWLPQYFEFQESVLIAELLEAHAAADGKPQPEAIATPVFWQWPTLSADNVGASACSLLVALAAFYAFPTFPQAMLWCLWCVGLVVLAFFDARTKLLPDVLTLPLMWLGLAIQLVPETRTVGLEMAVIGAIAGYLPLWLLAHAYRLLRGRDGLGMGDLKLLAAMGAWSGPFVLPQLLLLAALLAIAVFILERVLRGSNGGIHEERPFGPAIVVAYFIVLVFTH